jgi:protein ImuA
MVNAGRDVVLSELRERIERLERGGRKRTVLPFGIAAVDEHLSGNGLALGAVHEFMEAGAASEHSACAALFAAGILARLKGPVLWCLKSRDLFAPALASVGLHPDRVIYAETRRESEILPAVEEGLRHRGLAGVVGEVARLGLTPSRRLQLAAEESGVPALIIRRWRNDAERASDAEPSAATTRWRVTAAPSRPLPAPGIGRERWFVELIRCKGAEANAWTLEACDAKGRLALSTDLADRSLPQELQRRAVA